jgi:NTE family protein
MPTAIALSGGGAQGDFQVGALEFLYEQGIRPDRGIRPDIIAGTSVGAINATKLAEGEGAPDQGLAGLKALWLDEMKTNENMYRPEPWVNSFPVEARGVITLDDAPSTPDPEFFGRRLSEWAPIYPVVALAMNAAAELADDMAGRVMKRLSTENSVFNLEPIRQLISRRFDQGRLDAWSQQGGRLRLAMVCLENGRLRYVTERGQLLERDGSAVRVTVPSSACQGIIDEIESLEEQRNQLQDQLVFATPQAKPTLIEQINALNAEIRRKQAELEVCRQQNPPEVEEDAKVDIPTAVLASSAMPAIFRTISIHGETYVDAGIRELLPVQAAIDLGADTVYGIFASRHTAPAKREEPPPPQEKAIKFEDGPERVDTSKVRSVLEVASRSVMDIMLDEIGFGDAFAPPGGFGEGPVGPTVKIIQPSATIHDTLVIDPGLISILHAGWGRRKERRTELGAMEPRYRNLARTQEDMALGVPCARRTGAWQADRTCTRTESRAHRRNPTLEGRAPNVGK